MESSNNQSLQGVGEPDQRMILVVDGEPSYAEALRSAWTQLQLADELRIVVGREHALDELRNVHGHPSRPTVAAIVLDPDASGEETGAFLREVRNLYGEDAMPVVCWTHDGQKYEPLEGRGMDRVITKPMVLQVIQELDATCGLSVRRRPPDTGREA